MLFKNRKYRKLKDKVESILIDYPDIFKYFFSEFELFNAKLKYFKDPEGKYSTNLHPYDSLYDAQKNEFDNFIYGYIGNEISKQADQRHQELIQIDVPLFSLRKEIWFKIKEIRYIEAEPRTNIYLNFCDFTIAFALKLRGILNEIEQYDKDAEEKSVNHKQNTTNDIEPKQNDNKSKARGTKIKKGGLYFQDVRVLVKQLKERKSTFKIRSLWMNYCDYQLLKENSLYEQSNRGLFSKEIVSWTGGDFSYSFENNFDPKKSVFTGQISIIEEKKIQSKEIIDAMVLYIKECEIPEDNYDINYDYSFNDFKDWYFFDLEDDYIGWLSDEIYIVKPSDQLNFSLEKDFNLDLDRYSDIVSFTSCEMNIKSRDHTLLINEPKNETENLKWNQKEDNSNGNNSEIDSVHFQNKKFIENLGKLNQSLKKEQYQKEAYKLWKEFFEKQLNDYFKDWDEGHVSDDYEFEVSDEGQFLIQDVYTTVKYLNDEVKYIRFKLIYNDENETEESYLALGFPFVFLDDIPHIFFNFPCEYNDWTDDYGNHKELNVKGSLNDFCNKLSRLDCVDFNSLNS